MFTTVDHSFYFLVFMTVDHSFLLSTVYNSIHLLYVSNQFSFKLLIIRLISSKRKKIKLISSIENDFKFWIVTTYFLKPRRFLF